MVIYFKEKLRGNVSLIISSSMMYSSDIDSTNKADILLVTFHSKYTKYISIYSSSSYHRFNMWFMYDLLTYKMSLTI